LPIVISVVVPTYNRAHMLGRSIRSILAQTFQDFEIIVVDDGSTDDTQKVVRSFGDRRIRYVQHDENKGEAAARNTGIRLAKGEYIASQDSDDEWLPEKLAKQVEVLDNSPPDVGVVYTGFWKSHDGRKTYIPFSWVKHPNGNIHKQLLRGNFIGSPVTLIRKGCFEKVGMFDERLANVVDWEMWIRISKYYHFRYVAEPLVIAYYHSENISSSRKSLIDALELILEKHSEDFAKDEKMLAKQCFDIGSLLVSTGELEKGRRYLKRAARICPISIRTALSCLLILSGPSGGKYVVKLYEYIKKQRENTRSKNGL